MNSAHHALRAFNLILKDFSSVEFLQTVIEICVLGFNLVEFQINRSVLDHLVGLHVVVAF